MPHVVNQEETQRPPRGEEPPQSTATEKPRGSAKRTPDEKKLAEGIANGYKLLGTGITGISVQINDPGLQATGIQFINGAESIAEAWIDLGRQNPKVKAYLKQLTQVSAWGTVISMHLAACMPLLISRGVIPAFTVIPTEPTEEEGPQPSFFTENGSGTYT